MDLPIIHDNYSNCFQNMTISVAGYYNTDFQMMYLELIGFKYHDEGKTIGEKIALCWEGKIAERCKLLRTYHSLEFQYQKTANVVEELRNIDLDREIVAVYLDSFDCYWLPFYRKNHRPHLCLVVSEVNNDGFCLKDEYLEMPEKVSNDMLKVNATSFVSYKVKNSICSISKECVVFELKEILYRYERERMQEQLLHFVEDMKMKLDIEEEVSSMKDPVSSKLFMYLKSLSDDRLNISKLFEYIQFKCELDCRELINGYINLSGRYAKLRTYLIKCCFTNKFPKDSLVKSAMDEIYILEVKNIESIKKIVQGETDCDNGRELA